MTSQLSHVMTLANSIIGVSVLAMPYCFKQCGIILATLVLLFCSALSRLACHLLVKSAVMSRRRNFELLAFHAFGHMGKFLVELFIIGFLVGTCIAFFVVVGDLGPQIIGKMINKNPEGIRTSLLITTSVFIILPLGLLRNIDSLSSICTATIVFYLCLVLKVITESTQHIFAGDWYDHVYYWRPSGILQCLPIFSMALFCQTQLFEIYEAIPNVSLEKMNDVVRGALNICTLVYLCVGFFGYIAFCMQPFSGNILMSFEASLSSEMIKMGFVFSVAFSFPLVIFPCRASLNSLLFRRVYTHEPSINYIPETRFRCLTIAIVSISLIIGILIPNIEFVLGLVGSTIGVMICLIFPAAFFISISSKNTNERLLAQAILFVGIWIMVLGTYANLYAMEESTNTKLSVTTNKPLSQINNLPLNLIKDDIHIIPNVPNNPDLYVNMKDKVINELPDIKPLDKIDNAKDVRQEPPIPVERIIFTEKSVIETQRPLINNLAITFAPDIENIVKKLNSLNQDVEKDSNNLVKNNDAGKVEDIIALKTEQKLEAKEQKEKINDLQKNDNLINSDAIKKEESEIAADREVGNIIVEERHEELRKTLEKHKLEQLKMMQEQKKLLKDIKKQKYELERDKQRIAKDAEEIRMNERKQQQQQANENINNKQNDANDAGDEGRAIEEKSPKESDKRKMLKLDEVLEQSPNKVQNSQPKLVNGKDTVQIFKDTLKSETSDDQNAPKYRQDKSIVANDKDDAGNKVNDIIQPKQKLNNPSDLMKDPILNALTKRTLKKSHGSPDIAEQKEEHREDKIIVNDANINTNSNNDNNNNIPERKHQEANDRLQNQYHSLPIALKMGNHTKDANKTAQVLNKHEDGVQGARRDILENHDREKREVDVDVEQSDTKVTKIDQSHMIMVDQAKCSKSPEVPQEKQQSVVTKQRIEEHIAKIDTTTLTLIKTNIYLSEQGFTNAISLNSDTEMQSQYVKMKQRDLKAVKTEENSEI